MGNDSLLQHLAFLPPLILSLTVHEWAHAYSAFRLGDDTAARLGRLTLNPIPHIDPIGTILLPLLGVPFGWAKPVPVSPNRFRRDVSMRKGMMITASAGPASNIVLAVICVLLLGLLYRFNVRQPAMETFLTTGFGLNVILAFFNMLPIYPLDGSRVADGLMPYRFRPAWERFVQIGPLALLAVIVLPRMLNFSLFSWPMLIASQAAGWLLTQIVTL
ncbi:MAG: site-2 protease family protein [Myxococcales bacterium]|nr:site-2 protease family protein [Myxococcales bacterium]